MCRKYANFERLLGIEMDHLYTPLVNEHDVLVPIDEGIQRHADALRLRTGDHILVYNGRGLVANCRCERIEKEIRLHIVGHRLYDPPVSLWLAMGVLDHRERFEFAVEKAVELGATKISPLTTTYAQYHRSPLVRLEAKAQAALTQSGNPWLPEVTEQQTIEQILASTPDEAIIILGDARAAAPSLSDLDAARPMVVFVGPEGGFSQDEVETIKGDSRCRTWSVGTHRLRAETAAVALLSCVVALRG